MVSRDGRTNRGEKITFFLHASFSRAQQPRENSKRLTRRCPPFSAIIIRRALGGKNFKGDNKNSLE